MAMGLIEKVQKLIEIAENPTTPVGEAQAARLMADKLMLDNAIEEAMLNMKRPAASRMKPKIVEFALVGDPELVGYVAYLAEQVARHTNCRIKNYANWHDGSYHSKVYGFDSDVRYFEMLYTTLRLHMVGAIRPGVDLSKSIEDNAYALHSAGYNWFDIAKLYGWEGPVTSQPGEAKLMYVNSRTGERLSWSKAVAQYKRAYQRAIEARGETALHVSPAGVKTFQLSAAEGYARRIAQRLQEVRAQQPIGNVLAVRVSEVDKLFKEDNPELFKPQEPSNVKRRVRKVTYRPLNAQAYQSGVRRANTADLNPAASSGNTREIK